MKYLKYLFLISILSLFPACSDQSIDTNKTSRNIQSPEFVGIVNNQKLYRITIEIKGSFNQYVYYFQDSTNNSNILSVNTKIQQGKTQSEVSYAIINNKKYLLLEQLEK